MGLIPNTLNVDKENRRLNGVVAIEPMDIKDWRPFSINDAFVNDLVAAGNKAKEGVKSYFGHNYSNEGKLLGRATDWRVEDGKAKYNLTILKSAYDSPILPNVGNYLLNLMDEDDSAMMNSIVFSEDYFYQMGPEGKHIKCYFYDKDYNWIAPNPDLGKVYPKLGKLYSTDIVSEGAATNSMFNDQGEESSSPVKRMFNKLVEFFTEKDDDPLIISQKNQKMTEEFKTEMTGAINSLTSKIDSLVQALSPAPAPAPVETPTPEPKGPTAEELTALQEEINTLKAKLAKEPAAPETALNTGAGGDPNRKLEPWETDPMNLQAQDYVSQFAKD